jgi:tripartite ATP-independent transporter DctP family solute receptor
MTGQIKTMMLAATLAVASTFSIVTAQAEPLKLRLSGESPASGLDIMLIQRMADILKEKMGDDFEFELFHTEALGDEVVHMQQVRSGQIDVYPMGSDAVQLDTSWAFLDMPFLFKDRTVVAKVLDGEIGEELRASMRKSAGLEVLAFGEIGFRQITNNVRPIVTPADFQGMKLRVPGSPTRMLTFETLGATPVTMNFGEVYLALQNGTVDGQENPLADITARSLHEVQKYISISNHVYTPVTLVMNAAKYDSLTDEQKALVKEAAQAAAEEMRALGAEKDKELLAMLEAYEGVDLNEIDRAAFLEAAQPLYKEIGDIAGEALAQKVLAAVKE